MKNLILISLLSGLLSACGQSSSSDSRLSGYNQNDSTIELSITHTTVAQSSTNQATIETFYPWIRLTLNKENTVNVSFEYDQCLINRGITVSNIQIYDQTILYTYKDYLGHEIGDYRALEGCTIKLSIEVM